MKLRHGTTILENDLAARDRQPPSKLIWIYLEPFLAGARCPLCAYGDGSAERYLQSLLYEGVTDRFIRARLRRSLGLCSVHARRAFDFRDALFSDHVSLAVIYHDVTGCILRELYEMQAARGTPGPNFFLKVRMKKKARQLEKASQLPSTDCPACEHQQFAEEAALSCLLTRVGDELVAQKYREGPGLCLRHLSSALEHAAGTPGFEFLLRCEIKKFEEIRHLLRALEERFDARSDARPTREEALAPATILRKLAASTIPGERAGEL